MGQPNRQDILKIVSLITKKPVDSVRPEAKLRGDLGMDSLAALDLLVSIEEQFGIVIPQESASKFQTLQDVFDHLKI